MIDGINFCGGNVCVRIWDGKAYFKIYKACIKTGMVKAVPFLAFRDSFDEQFRSVFPVQLG